MKNGIYRVYFEIELNNCRDEEEAMGEVTNFLEENESPEVKLELVQEIEVEEEEEELEELYF